LAGAAITERSQQMRFTRKRGVAAIAACIASLCAALAAPAVAADDGEYPSDPAAQTFSEGLNGWTASSSFDGSCVPPLLCPKVDNEYVAAGDANGNGYITSSYLGVAGAGAVAGTTTGTWESPAFEYRTAAGDPEAAFFSMSRRADVGQLLAVAGNSALYAVQLADVTEGAQSVSVVAPVTMAGAESWTTIPRVEVKAGKLHSGDSYRVRIESRYKTGTSAVVSGSADYDNVVLRTAAAEAANGNGGKGNGSRRTLRAKQLLSLFSSGLANTVTVVGHGAAKGKRLFVKVSCPKSIGGPCRVTVQGLLRKHEAATAKRTVKVGKGKSRRIFLRVKPKQRAKVLKRKRLLVSEKVRAGGTSATAYKVRKLIRR
jgi:hypothetical protein